MENSDKRFLTKSGLQGIIEKLNSAEKTAEDECQRLDPEDLFEAGTKEGEYWYQMGIGEGLSLAQSYVENAVPEISLSEKSPRGIHRGWYETAHCEGLEIGVLDHSESEWRFTKYYPQDTVEEIMRAYWNSYDNEWEKQETGPRHYASWLIKMSDGKFLDVFQFPDVCIYRADASDTSRGILDLEMLDFRRIKI